MQEQAMPLRASNQAKVSVPLPGRTIGLKGGFRRAKELFPTNIFLPSINIPGRDTASSFIVPNARVEMMDPNYSAS